MITYCFRYITAAYKINYNFLIFTQVVQWVTNKSFGIADLQLLVCFLHDKLKMHHNTSNKYRLLINFLMKIILKRRSKK